MTLSTFTIENVRLAQEGSRLTAVVTASSLLLGLAAAAAVGIAVTANLMPLVAKPPGHGGGPATVGRSA